MLKRSLAFFLTLLICLSLLPAGALAEEDTLSVSGEPAATEEPLPASEETAAAEEPAPAAGETASEGPAGEPEPTSDGASADADEETAGTEDPGNGQEPAFDGTTAEARDVPAAEETGEPSTEDVSSPEPAVDASTHTVSFDACGGSITKSITVSEGGTYGPLPDPAREGYAFAGWYTDPETGTAVTADTAVEITADQTLYARWVKILGKPVISEVSGQAGRVKITWSPVEDAKRYYVYRRTDGEAEWTELGSTKRKFYTDRDTPAGAKYIYAVCCESSAGELSRSVLSKTKSITLKLPAPTLRSAKCAAGTGIRVTWTKVDGAAQYAVLRKGGASSRWERIGTTAKTGYTDMTCEAGTKYTYTVRCLSADGTVKVSSYEKPGVSATYLAAAPVLKSISNTSGGVRITWKKSDGAKKYQVYRKTGSGKWTKLATTAGTGFTDKNADSGKKYSYTVAVVTKDGKTVTSARDTNGRTITYLAAPRLKSVRNVTDGVRITWKAVSGAKKYCVYRMSDGGTEWTKLGTAKSVNYTDKTAETGKTYIYTVRAVSGSAKSAIRSGKRVTAEEPDWRLILVNASNPVPEGYSIKLTQLSNGNSVDSRIYPDLQAMFDAARAQGVYPTVREGYRTREYQESIMQNRISQYTAQGYSRETAESLARLYVAEPGTSEHELGLAVDINGASGYSDWNVYVWLADNAWKYGFILRYPDGKEDITGIEYEPWHYRYVGTEAAAEIYERQITLEEYLGEA